MSEHKYNLVHPSVEESSPLIELSQVATLVLAEHEFHVTHLPPLVSDDPGLRLPKVHKLFRKAGLVDDRYVFHGYGAYLRSLVMLKP